MTHRKVDCAIIGSGNIGTDLMLKISQLSEVLNIKALVGIDASSAGLEIAKNMGVGVCSTGIQGLLDMPEFATIRIVFDATSAVAHSDHDTILQRHGKQVIDLTPAAIGPYVIPEVNLAEHL
ncbi:MAG: acetaldehyde dehydrogenase (acetylating), partial [Rhodospirillales bacterium]